MIMSWSSTKPYCLRKYVRTFGYWELDCNVEPKTEKKNCVWGCVFSLFFSSVLSLSSGNPHNDGFVQVHGVKYIHRITETCENLWTKFSASFSYMAPCDVTMNHYDSYMLAASQKIPVNKASIVTVLRLANRNFVFVSNIHCILSLSSPLLCYCDLVRHVLTTSVVISSNYVLTSSVL